MLFLAVGLFYLHTMTKEQLSAIVNHLDPLIISADEAAAKLRTLHRRRWPPGYAKQIRYWLNVASGFRWAKQLAIQASGGPNGHSDETV